MKSSISMIVLGVALAMGFASPRAAQAEEAPAAATEERLQLGKTVDLAELDGQRGGADVQLGEIRAVGTVSEVQAYDLVTGHNIVSDGALAGAKGMPMLIQNSGNGVLIQNTTILNVQVK